MTMPIHFRYAGWDEYPRLSQFIHEDWENNHIYTRNKPLFDWTFGRANHWNQDGYSIAIAESGAEIVGMLGGIPFAFNHLGRNLNGVWIVNYVVRSDHRKGTAAFQLLSMFRRPPFDAVVAFGINPATSSIYRVLRGQVLSEIPRHFLVLPTARERMVELLHLANPEWAADRAQSLCAAFEISAADDAPARWETAVRADWDASDWPCVARETVGASRDRDYLGWRYGKHPCFEYRFISVPENGRSGLLVWRLETIQRQTPEGRVPVDHIGRVVEFLPASRKNARDLVAVLLRELSATDAIAADYHGYHGASRSWLRECGFRAVNEHPDGEAIPCRFQPLDGGRGGILGAFFVPPGLPNCTTSADCPWYWTKSDSDQDRPN